MTPKNINDIYLTEEYKQEALELLKECRKSGDVDEWMNPYLDVINSLNGVVTTQSCMGHDDKGTAPVGHVVFKTTRKVSDALEFILSELSYKDMFGFGFTMFHKEFRKDEGAYYILWFDMYKRAIAMCELIDLIERSVRKSYELD